MSDPALIRDPIAEVIALALAADDTSGISRPPEHYRDLSCRIRAAVTPLIRAAALEEAAQVAEECLHEREIEWMKVRLSTKIRALKEQP